MEAVALATLEWVDWFGHRRLLGPIGGTAPAKAGARYYAARQEIALAARLKPIRLRQARAGSIRPGFVPPGFVGLRALTGRAPARAHHPVKQFGRGSQHARDVLALAA